MIRGGGDGGGGGTQGWIRGLWSVNTNGAARSEAPLVPEGVTERWACLRRRKHLLQEQKTLRSEWSQVRFDANETDIHHNVMSPLTSFTRLGLGARHVAQIVSKLWP